jgi:hypothetical protein
MNPYQKAARLLLWLVAMGMILIGGLLAAIELLNHRVKGMDISAPKLALNSLIFVAGIVLFAVAGKIAVWFAEKIDS